MAMGIAEVIPGVSGGTIAFITGIYERLIRAITNVKPSLLSQWQEGGFGAVWRELDGTFLLQLAVGMVMGIVVGVFGVSHLLETSPEPLWGFFFGLIAASCIYIGKQVKGWGVKPLLALIVGAAIAYGITVMAPAEGSDSYPMIFISGVLAISALILPGISGSFILLMLGMYHIVIPTVKDFLSTRDMESFGVVVVFALGAAVGLLCFSRVVRYMWERYEQVTLALLTGFMLGSLNKIWPWRNVEQVKLDDGSIAGVSGQSAWQELPHDGFKILLEQNVLPADYWMGSPKVAITLVAAAVGFGLVFVLERLGK